MRPARAPDAVDVILRLHREIVVHHVRNAVHINPARGNIRGHQHADRAGLEIFQRPQPLGLRTVRMQRGGADALAFQVPGNAVGPVFHPRKHQHHVHAGILQQVNEQGGFQVLGHFINKLRDGLGWVRAAANLHDLGRALEFVGERLDLLGQSGGEHQRLPVLGQRVDDLADGGQETHVQHAVGFVQHQELQPGEIRAPLAHQIQQAARTGDDDIRGGTQGLDLRLLAHSAEDGGHTHRQMAGISPHVVMNLHHQFARGGQHQHPGGPALPGRERRGQFGQNGQSEGGGLAGARLGDADEVVARQNWRDGGGLNRRRLRIAGFLHGGQYFGIKAKAAEWHVCQAYHTRPG